jgi:plasmid stability protein
MATLKITGISDRLYRALERRAVANGRSIEDEVIACLERSCEPAPFSGRAWLAKLDRLHRRFPLAKLTDGQIRAERRRGRP